MRHGLRLFAVTNPRPYCRASFERVRHVAGLLAAAGHQDIEDELIDAVEVPEDASAVSVSLDRVSVPVEDPRPRLKGRLKKGAPKKSVARNFRMVYCGTVTLHDKEGTVGSQLLNSHFARSGWLFAPLKISVLYQSHTAFWVEKY